MRRDFRTGSAGFTLIELVAVMTLLALVSALATPYISSALGVQVKSTARQLAGTMKYVFDEAAIRNVNLRLVFNLDRHGYKVEECGTSDQDFFGAPLLYHSAEDKQRGQDAMDEAARRAQDYASSGSAPPPPQDPLQSCKPVNDVRVSEVTFEEPLTLLGVWTPQYKAILRGHPDGPSEDPSEDTLAEVYFLKGGYAERVFIYLSDGGEDIYTLELEPLTGRVTLHDGEKEVPSEYWR